MSRTKDLSRPPQLLATCFDCFCENGLENTGTQKLAKACNMSPGNLFFYFETKAQIIRESTALCMEKVEDDFMARAPKDLADLNRFLDEMPYITAREHGKKYRFMYQVYASPQYRKEGEKFFEGVNERYRAYAEELAPKLNIPVDLLQGLIYIFVRACVHYALFEDEEYLKLQIQALRTSLSAITGQDFSAPATKGKARAKARTSGGTAKRTAAKPKASAAKAKGGAAASKAAAKTTKRTAAKPKAGASKATAAKSATAAKPRATRAKAQAKAK